jgi:7,8-dihydroneopterin aldolase/epimerase/oxygenase
MSADPHISSGQIHIEQLEIFARIGVPDAERAAPQRLVANITLSPACDLRDLNDDISRTVNYSALCAETKKFVAENSHKLLETLTYNLTRHLLKTFAIRQITLELRKFVLSDAQFASVTVTRSAAEE